MLEDDSNVVTESKTELAAQGDDPQAPVEESQAEPEAVAKPEANVVAASGDTVYTLGNGDPMITLGVYTNENCTTAYSGAAITDGTRCMASST
ncbi:hypothetical protein [Paratractidigestivibacter sp.]|uniref:hypothetical protein n=1 Tax=Paratractidigestivibacter sp. TaxID=2847316 RepID=UPI002ABE4F72|nr:hypothetical protein [Paratractidigestivibacter sp.]